MRSVSASFFAAALIAASLSFTTACGGDDGVGELVELQHAFDVASSFDVQGDFGDSGLGSALNTLDKMSDHEDDPGRYVVQQIVDALPAPLSWAAEELVDDLGKQVNAAIYEIAPTAADDVKAIAAGLSEAARQFELASHLEVGLDADDNTTANHRLKSVTYSYLEKSVTVTAEELGDKVETTKRIPALIDGDALTIPKHELQLPVGTLLDKALDGVVVPGVVEDATSFAQLVERWFACEQVGALVADVIGAGASEVASACKKGAGSLSDKVHEKILALDKEGALVLDGASSIGADGAPRDGSGWSGFYVLEKDTKAPLEPQRCPFTTTHVTSR